MSKLPRYLIPKYFDMLVTHLYTKALERCWCLMSGLDEKTSEKLSRFKLINASSFLRWLTLGGVALAGHLRDCPMPNTLMAGQEDENDRDELVLSMSAGLPHFSVSYMRSWGRDTFISLKGKSYSFV
jgi:glycogen debranching enzyme